MLTLTELFEKVNGIGGRLRRNGDGCVVDGPAEHITPAITAALAEHQATLLTLLPAQAPVNNQPDRANGHVEMTEEEFFAQLDAM